MSRPRKVTNPADVCRSNGWKVGDVLYGGEIVVKGTRIERPKLALITAVGEERVLARTRLEGEEDWRDEHFIQFSSREWRRAKEGEF